MHETELFFTWITVNFDIARKFGLCYSKKNFITPSAFQKGRSTHCVRYKINLMVKKKIV
jgi:hypothetical protein